MMRTEAFADTLRRLARERGISVNSLSFQAYNPNVRGTNPDTLRAVMYGRRQPSIALMEALAQVLEVDPREFAEYRLLVVRQSIDERIVGLDQALENLSALPFNPANKTRLKTKAADQGSVRAADQIGGVA